MGFLSDLFGGKKERLARQEAHQREISKLERGFAIDRAEIQDKLHNAKLYGRTLEKALREAWRQIDQSHANLGMSEEELIRYQILRSWCNDIVDHEGDRKLLPGEYIHGSTMPTLNLHAMTGQITEAQFLQRFDDARGVIYTPESLLKKIRQSGIRVHSPMCGQEPN